MVLKDSKLKNSIIRFVFLKNYSGCSVANGLQRRETKAGKPQRLLIAFWQKMMMPSSKEEAVELERSGWSLDNLEGSITRT